jgi:hypothetical protein
MPKKHFGKKKNPIYKKSSGFKMKGYSYPGKSPIEKSEGRETVRQYAEGEKHIGTSGRTPAELRALADKAEADGNIDAANSMRETADNAEREQESAQKTLKA